MSQNGCCMHVFLPSRSSLIIKSYTSKHCSVIRISNSKNQISMDFFTQKYKLTGLRFTLATLHSTLVDISICVEWIGKLQGFIWSAAQHLGLVSNLSVTTRSQQLMLCLSLLQLQRSHSPGELLSKMPRKTTTAKEAFGHDRNSILCWFIFLPLSPLLLISSSAPPFLGCMHHTSSPFPIYAILGMLLLVAAYIPSFCTYTHFFPLHPSPPYILFLPSSLPPSPLLLLYASQAPAPHYVSLPGQCCQQLEHITANCATCGPLKGRKRGEEGTALCQWRWGGWVICGGEVECFTAFWILPQSTVFNYQ